MFSGVTSIALCILFAVTRSAFFPTLDLKGLRRGLGQDADGSFATYSFRFLRSPIHRASKAANPLAFPETMDSKPTIPCTLSAYGRHSI